MSSPSRMIQDIETLRKRHRDLDHKRVAAEANLRTANDQLETLRKEATMHRLWYDLRAQSLFEAAFRPDVAEIDKSLEKMIWRVMSRFAEITGATLHVPSSVAYAMFDGLFQQGLLKHLSGDKKAVAAMQSHVRLVVSQLVGVPAPAPARRRRSALAA